MRGEIRDLNLCTRINFMSHLSGPLGEEILETKRFDDPAKTYFTGDKLSEVDNLTLGLIPCRKLGAL